MDNETKRFFEELTGSRKSKKKKKEEEVEVEEDIEEEEEEEEDKEEEIGEEDEDYYEDEDELGLASEREGQLAIDVYQTDKDIIVESPIAGVEADTLDVHITSEAVTIKGRRERKKTIKDENYFYQECYWGKFSRSVILPQEVDADSSKATIKNGVLMISMPKLDRKKGKKLKIKVD